MGWLRAFVEAEVVLKHVVSEPTPGETVEQDLVKVVSDSASVLYLSDHVSHCRPRNALQKLFKLFSQMNVVIELRA